MADTCPVCMAQLDEGLGVCPFCGFKLLGTTQEFKPISLDTANAHTERVGNPNAVLRVLRGPQIGMSYKIGPGVSSIGRNPQCTVFLNDMTVSRLHARIEYVDDCHVIYDENSYNGVWVNNKSVEARALTAGDYIQIGTFLLEYTVA